MVEQILKLDGRSEMGKILPQLIQLIERKFEGTSFEILHHRKDENVYILQNPMMIVCVEKNIVKVSFHVAVRSDVAYHIIMKFKEIEGIKSLDVANVFYYDPKESKVYYGLEAEKKMLTDLKSAVLTEFVHEQAELMMLRNMKSPYVC